MESNNQMKNNKLPYRKNSGFQIPDQYFQDFEERLMQKVQQENLLPEGMETYSRKPGFVVPDGYFSALEGSILNSINKEEQKVIPLFPGRKLFYAAAVAAVFIGLVSTLFLRNENSEFTMDSIELSALENYIEEGYFDLDFVELSAFMTEDGYSFGDYNTDRFSDEAVYNYINENIEDPEFLFE